MMFNILALHHSCGLQGQTVGQIFPRCQDWACGPGLDLCLRIGPVWSQFSPLCWDWVPVPHATSIPCTRDWALGPVLPLLGPAGWHDARSQICPTAGSWAPLYIGLWNVIDWDFLLLLFWKPQVPYQSQAELL